MVQTDGFKSKKKLQDTFQDKLGAGVSWLSHLHLVNNIFELIFGPVPSSFQNQTLQKVFTLHSCSNKDVLGRGYALLYDRSCWLLETISWSILASIQHSCLKWPLKEIYNFIIFVHLSYSAIWVPNWNTWQKYFSWALFFFTEMIKTFWGGKEDASLARNKF